MRVSNIYLHPSISNPELLTDLIMATGLIAVQSNREKNKILMVTPEAALIRSALDGLKQNNNEGKL